jgi:hypothetical protein
MIVGGVYKVAFLASIANGIAERGFLEAINE